MDMDKPSIALIGMGLIGSSIGHALKKTGLPRMWRAMRALPRHG